MERRGNMVLTVVLVALFQSSAAQTTHVVGGAMGWVIPPGGQSAYDTWAANQTFTVGDILVFNYTAGQHDVAHSTKQAFDACNASLPIISVTTTAPARITLNTTGENYFFCTVTGHCSAGQKLAINVSAVSSPAPSSSPAHSPAPATVTPSPASSPTQAPEISAPSPITSPSPAPSRAPVTYIVGDGMGWVIPTGGEAAYQTWAANKTFIVGDTLVFNFTTGAHDVAEVTKTAYAACNSNATISTIATGPARITLNTSGEHFYICTVGRHCSLGQKLAINVTGDGSTTATPPSSIANPPSTSATPSTPSANSPGSSTTPSTPGSFAPSSTTTGFLATFLTISAAAYLLF